MAKDNHEQLYTILMEIKEDIGRIEQKVDSVHVQATKTNGRVSMLEGFRDNLKGKVAIIVIVGGFMFNVFWTWVKKEINL